LPPLAFVITKRICLSLQRADRELVLHGKETGRLVMLPSGEFIEIHEELSEAKKYTLTQHEQPKAIELVTADAGGVLNPKGIRAKLQARFSAANAENIAKPTATEVKELEGGHH
jgi:ubiquinol-cytochrome c reductase cytochrome b subunit